LQREALAVWPQEVAFGERSGTAPSANFSLGTAPCAMKKAANRPNPQTRTLPTSTLAPRLRSTTGSSTSSLQGSVAVSSACRWARIPTKLTALPEPAVDMRLSLLICTRQPPDYVVSEQPELQPMVWGQQCVLPGGQGPDFAPWQRPSSGTPGLSVLVSRVRRGSCKPGIRPSHIRVSVAIAKR
jgi:hypothetical protein